MSKDSVLYIGGEDLQTELSLFCYKHKIRHEKIESKTGKSKGIKIVDTHYDELKYTFEFWFDWASSGRHYIRGTFYSTNYCATFVALSVHVDSMIFGFDNGILLVTGFLEKMESCKFEIGTAILKLGEEIK